MFINESTGLLHPSIPIALRPCDGDSIGTKVVGINQLASEHGRSMEELDRFMETPAWDGVTPFDIAFHSISTREACTGHRDNQIICHGCLITPPDYNQNIQSLDSNLRPAISGIKHALWSPGRQLKGVVSSQEGLDASS